MDTITEQQRFCDREFTVHEVSIIQEVIANCIGLSRFELAHTVCELLDWKRPNGRLKARECRDLLERLEDIGVVRLPEKKSTGSKASRKHKDAEVAKHSFSTLTGSVEAFLPLRVELVQRPEQRELFLELMGRYHYLGYAMPYGARLQYLISVEQPRCEVVGCVQFSSPAWRIKDRDQWIGWDDETRKSRLQHIVNNSRLLILARIDNLASKMLSDVMRRLRCDWGNEYRVEPWLVETMVDRQRFQGGCYRAANFLEIGQTTGRGRNDQTKERRESEIKTVLVYPLIKYARQKLSAVR